MVYLVGADDRTLVGSTWHHTKSGETTGALPQADLKTTKKTSEVIRELVEKELLASVDVVGGGGLLVTLAKQCIQKNRANLGLSAELKEKSNQTLTQGLFGEALGVFVLSVDTQNETRMVELLDDKKVGFCKLGTVGGSDLSIEVGSTRVVDVDLKVINSIWRNGFRKSLDL